MTPRVHHDRAAEGARHAHGPFEADDALVGEAPSRNGQPETGAGVDDDQANPVGAVDGVNLVDARHDDVAEAFADVLDPLDDEPKVIQGGAQLVGRLRDVDELAQP